MTEPFELKQEYKDLFLSDNDLSVLGKPLLSERDRTIARMRWGYGSDSKRYTLRELARRFSVSDERIRQIECKVIRRLYAVMHRHDVDDETS
jgi:DNA-directed RNA polymerase sigma subunit (sigma70/sigma32)